MKKILYYFYEEDIILLYCYDMFDTFSFCICPIHIPPIGGGRENVEVYSLNIYQRVF